MRKTAEHKLKRTSPAAPGPARHQARDVHTGSAAGKHEVSSSKVANVGGSEKNVAAKRGKSRQDGRRFKKQSDPGALIPFDIIIEQWQKERPDLDPAPIRLFGIIAQVHALTTPYMNRALARHKLTRASFDVLSALRRAGPPYALTPKRLAESLMLSGAGMTSRLDTLETMNLIARLPEPNDRRSLQIQLTQRGIKLIDDVIPEVLKAQWALVADFGESETRDLIALLSRLTETFLRPPSA
jgi:DNA-binding MarR family transcriptional regulator